MQDSKYTGWQGGTVVMVLGDNGAEVAMLQGVVGMGWQLCGAVTVQGENEEEGSLDGAARVTMAWASDGAGRQLYGVPMV